MTGSDTMRVAVVGHAERAEFARVERVPRPGEIVHTDAATERTITVVGVRVGPRGDDPLPWTELERAGDSFAAGVTYGLAAGWEPARALELGARCGAACRTGRGPYEGQLRG